MRICDKCGEVARDRLIFEVDTSQYDLCQACTSDVIALISQPIEEKPKKGRPKKDRVAEALIN